MENQKIAIIGLGYVGLPLAVEFAKHFEVVGFDINKRRVDELRKNLDITLETESHQLQEVNVDSYAALKKNGKGLWNSFDLEEIKGSNIYIVTVPTPVDKNNRPDFYAFVQVQRNSW